jgi:exopolysaccharide biosynthesis protein
MKKISVFICVHLWLFTFCFSAAAQDFKIVQDGVEYAEYTREIDKTPVRMNLLRLDLSKVRLDVVHAFDAAIGVEKTSSIAARHGAIAAINAGFFRLDQSLFAGEAAGVLQIDNVLLSESNQTRIALFISNDITRTEVKIGHLDARATVTVNKKFFQIAGINTSRKENELILYTPEFSRTTLTEPSGVEVVVRKNKIVKVNVNQGSTEIPADGFVLSVTGKGIVPAEFLEYAKVKSKVRLNYNFARMDQGEIDATGEDIVGGVPQLIRDGRLEITWQEEKSSKAFVETKHPRTAVAKLKDGKFLMVTVDGRSESSGGIGLEELARLLLEFGAVDAMNLDGGGSTTMFLGGKVVNHPSDKEGERKVSDAILVFPRKK